MAEQAPGQHVLATGKLYILRFGQKKMSPCFAAAFFDGEDGKLALRGKGSGAAIRALSLADLKDVFVPLPPAGEKEQRRRGIARRSVRELRAKFARAREALAGACAGGVLFTTRREKPVLNFETACALTWPCGATILKV